MIWYKSRHEIEGLHLEELRERRRSEVSPSVSLIRVACRSPEGLGLVFDKAKSGENQITRSRSSQLEIGRGAMVGQRLQLVFCCSAVNKTGA